MRLNRKFINQSNLRLKLKKIPQGNPKLDAEDLPVHQSDDGSKFLKDIRQVDDLITESFQARR